MKRCPYHDRELVQATVTDSRGKVTTFLRCPFKIVPEPEHGYLPGGLFCSFKRPLKLYSPTGERRAARKTKSCQLKTK